MGVLKQGFSKRSRWAELSAGKRFVENGTFQEGGKTVRETLLFHSKDTRRN